MKKIILHGAAVRNDGSYADAGSTLAIGESAHEIAAGRAKALLDARTAIDATPKANS